MFNFIYEFPFPVHLPEKCRSNKELVLICVKKDYESLEYASEDLRNDPDVVWMAMFGRGA
jgi:hypothetical protein